LGRPWPDGVRGSVTLAWKPRRRRLEAARRRRALGFATSAGRVSARRPIRTIAAGLGLDEGAFAPDPNGHTDLQCLGLTRALQPMASVQAMESLSKLHGEQNPDLV